MPAAAGADPAVLSTYLAARAADAGGAVDLAADRYARALAAAPTSATIAGRAYREAIAAGDDALAARALAVLAANGAAPDDGPLLALSRAAARRDDRAAATAIDGLGRGGLAMLVPTLRAWLAAARGQDPLPILAAVPAREAVATRFAAENRALLLIARGDEARGIAALGQSGAGAVPLDVRVAAAQLLIGRGRRDAAAAILAGDDPVLVGLRQGKGAKPTLAFGLSRLLTRVAADLRGPGPSPLALALSRAALRADPADDRARLLLADALARDGATDRALAELDRIPVRSPYAAAVAAARPVFLAGAGRDADALTAAAGSAAKGGVADWQRYADRLMAADRFVEAAAWYRRVLDAGPADDWAAWLQYGGALERAGDWAAARPALAKAVALAPESPLALNFLGYAQLVRGEDVAASTRMLERASALKPDDDSIRDSLAWAYHRSGQSARALPMLERAAAGEPTNAEIGDHLGDVLWSVGRRYEARYAWRAAALTADPAMAARIAGKIADGLPR